MPPQRLPVTDTLIEGFAPIKDVAPDAARPEWYGGSRPAVPDNEPPEAPNARGRRPFVIGVIVLVVLLGAAVIVALRDQWAPDAQGNAGAQTPAGMTSAEPGGEGGDGAADGGSDATAASAEASQLSAVAAAEAWRWGTVRLSVGGGAAAQAFDLDTGTAHSLAALPASRWPDVVVAASGLTTLNGAGYAGWTGTGEPTPEGCRAAGAKGWAPVVARAVLKPAVTVCLITSDGRIGWFKIDTVQVQPPTGYVVALTYVVWRKPGE